MILELKLRKIGNSVGLILPKEALSHLQAEEGQTVLVEGKSDGSLRMNAAKDAVARQLKVAGKIMHRYRNTLRELAK